MNSLVGYGSDDNSEDSGDERFPEMLGKSANSKTYRQPAPHEDNYEEVGMDMSEDSNDSSNRELSESSKSSKPDKSNHASSSVQRTDRRSSSRSPKQYRGDDRRSQREDRHKIDERHRRRDARGSREPRDNDRNRRDDDKGRDRHERRDRRDERHSRDRRERRRSRSKERRRSRSPRKSRSPKDRSRDRGSRGFASRKEKADKRMNRLDRLGIEFKPDSYPASALEDAELQSTQGDRFFIPGITGRFRDQIEKRKLLWQKAKEPEESTAKPNTAPVSLSTAAGSKSSKVYEATTFADDKTSNKFKRLMGIKETDTANLPVKSTDVLKKQQEMFSSMEAQYEVARTATHTMRGVGLGFGSLQR